MERVFVTYRLRPETTRETYAEFSRQKDQVIVPHVPGILRFGVHVAEAGATSDGTRTTDLPFDVIETIDVAGWDAWLNVIARDEVRAMAEEFATLADLDSLRMISAAEV